MATDVEPTGVTEADSQNQLPSPNITPTNSSPVPSIASPKSDQAPQMTAAESRSPNANSTGKLPSRTPLPNSRAPTPSSMSSTASPSTNDQASSRRSEKSLQATDQADYARILEGRPSAAMQPKDIKNYPNLAPQWITLLQNLGFEPGKFPDTYLADVEGLAPHSGKPKGKANVKPPPTKVPSLNFLIHLLLAKCPMELEVIWSLLIVWKLPAEPTYGQQKHNNSLRHSLSVKPEFFSSASGQPWRIATTEQAADKAVIENEKRMNEKAKKSGASNIVAEDKSSGKESVLTPTKKIAGKIGTTHLSPQANESFTPINTPSNVLSNSSSNTAANKSSDAHPLNDESVATQTPRKVVIKLNLQKTSQSIETNQELEHSYQHPYQHPYQTQTPAESSPTAPRKGKSRRARKRTQKARAESPTMAGPSASPNIVYSKDSTGMTLATEEDSTLNARYIYVPEDKMDPMNRMPTADEMLRSSKEYDNTPRAQVLIAKEKKKGDELNKEWKSGNDKRAKSEKLGPDRVQKELSAAYSSLGTKDAEIAKLKELIAAKNAADIYRAKKVKIIEEVQEYRDARKAEEEAKRKLAEGSNHKPESQQPGEAMGAISQHTGNERLEVETPPAERQDSGPEPATKRARNAT